MLSLFSGASRRLVNKRLGEGREGRSVRDSRGGGTLRAALTAGRAPRGTTTATALTAATGRATTAGRLASVAGVATGRARGELDLEEGLGLLLLLLLVRGGLLQSSKFGQPHSLECAKHRTSP